MISFRLVPHKQDLFLHPRNPRLGIAHLTMTTSNNTLLSSLRKMRSQRSQERTSSTMMKKMTRINSIQLHKPLKPLGQPIMGEVPTLTSWILYPKWISLRLSNLSSRLPPRTYLQLGPRHLMICSPLMPPLHHLLK